MLDNDQLAEVREEYLGLLHGIAREGSDIEGLVEWMDSHGFFESPATKEYYCAFDGGLMLHSINVYKTLERLAGEYASKDVDGAPKMRYSKDTLLIVGLLHGICKSGLYEKCSRNEKAYSKYGKSKDALGFFDWKSTVGYKVKDEDKREIYGGYGFSSYFIISGFIPLTTEESIVLANFNDILSDEANKPSMYQILSRFPLASLMLSATSIASYCIENPKAMEF